MAGNLTEKEIIDMKDAFAIFDKNNDGYIKKAEVKDILVSLKVDSSPEQIENIIKQVDADGDGVLNFSEFLNMMAADCTDGGMQSAGALDHMFKIFDRDGDGFITHSEMKRALDEMEDDPVPHGEIEEMIRDADSDGDGKLSFAEFESIMKVTHPKQYQ